MSLRAAPAAALLLVAACGPGEDRLTDVDLQRALDRLRHETAVSAEDRRLLLAAVEQHAARGPAAVEAKAACVGAYRRLLDAEDAVASAERQIQAAQAAGAPLEPHVGEVGRAEKLLAAAREAMPACDAAAARLAIAVR